MNDKMIEALNVLAAKLGVTAEYLWSVLVRQAHVSLWGDYVFYTITFAIVLLWAGTLKKTVTKATNAVSEEAEIMWILVSIAGGILSVILVLIAVCSIEGTITKIYNPEFWALNQVLHILK